MAMQDKGRPSLEPPSREASLSRIVMNADIREERSYSMDEFVHASNMVEKNLKQLNDGLDRAMRTRQSTSELQHILEGLQEKHQRSATMRRQMSQETMNQEKEKSDKRQVELKNELTLAQTLIKQTLQQVWDLQAKQASIKSLNADADGAARSRRGYLIALILVASLQGL